MEVKAKLFFFKCTGSSECAKKNAAWSQKIVKYTHHRLPTPGTGKQDFLFSSTTLFFLKCSDLCEGHTICCRTSTFICRRVLQTLRFICDATG